MEKIRGSEVTPVGALPTGHRLKKSCEGAADSPGHPRGEPGQTEALLAALMIFSPPARRLGFGGMESLSH